MNGGSKKINIRSDIDALPEAFRPEGHVQSVHPFRALTRLAALQRADHAFLVVADPQLVRTELDFHLFPSRLVALLADEAVPIGERTLGSGRDHQGVLGGLVQVALAERTMLGLGGEDVDAGPRVFHCGGIGDVEESQYFLGGGGDDDLLEGRFAGDGGGEWCKHGISKLILYFKSPSAPKEEGMLWRGQKGNGSRSLLELHQDGSHVVAAVWIGRRGAWVQILIEELLQTLTAVECAQLIDELTSELLVVVSVLLPDAVTSYQKQLFLPIAGDFDDIGHAGDGLLVERQPLYFLVAEITDRPGQIEAIYSSLDDGHACLGNSCLFHLVLRLVIEGQRHAATTLPQSGPRISGIGANNLLFRDRHHHCRRSRTQLILSRGSTQLLRLVLKQLRNSWLKLQQQFDIDECFGQRLSYLPLLQDLAFGQYLHEVLGDELRHLSTAMAIEYAEDGNVVMAGHFQFGNEGVLHVLPPSLHLAGGEFVVPVLPPRCLLGGDGFFEVTVAHT